MNLPLALSLVLLVLAAFTLRQFRTSRQNGACFKSVLYILLLVAESFSIFVCALANGHTWNFASYWLCFNLLVAMAFLIVLSLFLSKSSRPVQRRGSDLNVVEGLRLAILINIEAYEFLLPVHDGKIDDMKEFLEARGWRVLMMPNLKASMFNTMMHLLSEHMSGSTGAEIFVYISCHSRMLFGDPYILPTDARNFGFWRGMSIYELLYRINDASATQPRVMVCVNGCLDPARRCEKLAWCVRRKDCKISSKRLPRPREARFTVLFACDPGRCANGDFFTSQLLEVWREDPNRSFQAISKEVQSRMWSRRSPAGGPLQHPWLWSNGESSQIPLNPNAGLPLAGGVSMPEFVSS